MRTIRISIAGIVQGVGFRPFVYREAIRWGVHGQVYNTEAGVEITAQGADDRLESFLEALKNSPPRPSRIESFSVTEVTADPLSGFTIETSRTAGERSVRISPDLAVCADCLHELFSSADRRYAYPYINCTNCGPRFTIIKDIPYDRRLTTMAPYRMCPACEREYQDPGDRRFHAQPNACHVCGPAIRLLERTGAVLGEGGDADGTTRLIRESARLLEAGMIIAVKGLGGYHIACRADDETVVARLRSRKHRECKPFALMVRDAAAAGRLTHLSDEAEIRLSASDAPILLLPVKHGHGLAAGIAPGINTCGVMLPSTPLQHLIARAVAFPLVMTSANLADEPIAFKDDDARKRLADICDYFITGEREIHVRADDSVLKLFRGADLLVRRSRGIAPQPVTLARQIVKPLLAVGAEMKNTICLAYGTAAWTSQHIGDLENREAFKAFLETVDHFRKLIRVTPRLIAHDLHPRYLSTQFVLDPPPGHEWVLETLKFPVQHHHAHIVSAMAEHGIGERVIGVAFDGTGLGTDNTIWGGEIMTVDYRGFERRAWLEPVVMPGGDLAVREPWRMALAYLYATFGEAYAGRLPAALVEMPEIKRLVTIQQLKQSSSLPLTSSCGRLFDALASLCGVCREARYEGQPAAMFESLADPSCGDGRSAYPFSIVERQGNYIIGWREMLAAVLEDLARAVPVPVISARFHAGLAGVVIETVNNLARDTGLKKVVLSGGCFVNRLLLERIVSGLERHGLAPILNTRVPGNDGGISLGQAVIAAACTEQ